MAELDDALFSIGELVDLRAVRRDGKLVLDVLCAPGAEEDALREGILARLPEAAQLTIRPVTAEDRALYPGKRRIVNE